MRTLRDENLTLDQLVDIAAKELPESWHIAIYIENGSAWVELYDEVDEHVRVAQENTTLKEALGAAIDMAKTIDEMNA